MGVGELGGKIDGSKVIKSPRRASNMAWRRLPEPLSATDLIMKIFPDENGSGVGGQDEVEATPGASVDNGEGAVIILWVGVESWGVIVGALHPTKNNISIT